MPKTALKQKTRQKAKTTTRSPFEPGRPVHDDSDVEMDAADGDDSDEVPEKDEVEEKLERMLFGDDEGFHEALKNRSLATLAVGSDDESVGSGEDGEGDLEGVDDADLFFLDSGAAPVSTDLANPATALSDGEDGALTEPALWHDSDDERLTVSLASQNRLRKLRVAESEDVISGKEYVRRLRRQFLQLHPTPEWANPELNQHDSDSDREMDSDDEEAHSTQPLAKLLQGVTDLTKLEEQTHPGGKRKLRQETLDIQRLKDVGKDQPSSIDSLAFHPHYPILLSSGPAATLFLHHIAPSAPAPNPLLTSFHIRQTPIHTSAFAPPTGNKILASGRRRYFHIWDLDTGKVDKVNGTADRKEEQKTMERFKLSPCGRYIGLVGSSRKGGGLINVLNSGTAQWIAQVRVDGRGGVADFAWWSDGEGMTVVSKNGEVSEWDGSLNRVVARWTDAGAVGTTVLTLGGRSGRSELGGDRYVAIGSSSGVVNVYDRRPWAASLAKSSSSSSSSNEPTIPRNPEPIRALDQLTTPISHVVFAPDGQFFVMASRWKRDALRIVHLPSCTVYRNWPTSNTPLGRISSVAVSPNSELVAVGNEQGRIRLWEIRG
ncbi:putative small nucleolar ribonucleo protein complex subunit [Aspergillus campestris IBT 28561]|uniref:Small nucleolar ribonucleo protein complex subunit n=1 Tax=Aspergillus campestris (strain IBT 28561) TaxID=1392248 RepID=A0A2I1CZ82_ASPC2|nr:putative small nucleolar ribonucleo protein complex subunit [Aspergillus campestris IBT 28561]PKY02933.1 putative small nucleolar ribonucleo protein complex subunit [Aspergillus campestris IBT 28561]